MKTEPGSLDIIFVQAFCDETSHSYGFVTSVTDGSGNRSEFQRSSDVCTVALARADLGQNVLGNISISSYVRTINFIGYSGVHSFDSVAVRRVLGLCRPLCEASGATRLGQALATAVRAGSRF